MDRFLDCQHVSAGYGDMAVVSDFNLQVRKGESICILGPNGCGKSTILKTITGLIRPLRGSVSFWSSDEVNLRAEAVARFGVGYVPQTKDVFPSLTVDENLMTVGYETRDIEEVFAMLPTLREIRRLRAGTLSGGQRKILGIARILMARDLKAVLLDEPTAGMSPMATEVMLQLFRGLKEAGMSLVMVEQNVDVALKMCERTCVLVGGSIKWLGDSSEIRSRSQLFEMFLGE